MGLFGKGGLMLYAAAIRPANGETAVDVEDIWFNEDGGEFFVGISAIKLPSRPRKLLAPPDMKGWFGFSPDPEGIIEFAKYESDPDKSTHSGQHR